MNDKVKIHVNTVLDRLKEKLLQFVETLPATKEQYLNFTKDLGEFYSHEINKIKRAFLADLEDEALAKIEALTAKEQNAFYEAEIKKKLEESSELTYTPKLPEIPSNIPRHTKLTVGTILGGTAGAAVSSFMTGSSVSTGAASIMTGVFGKLLIILVFAGIGALSTDKIGTHIENVKVEKALDRFLKEELTALEDFSDRIESLYKFRVNEFFEKEGIILENE